MAENNSTTQITSSKECAIPCSSSVSSYYDASSTLLSNDAIQDFGSLADRGGRSSTGSGLFCPKDLDHTHPLLGGLPLNLGPRQPTMRRTLTLDERIRVIDLYDAGMSARKIAESLGVGKTQIQNTVKKKEEYMTDFANSVSGDAKRRPRKTPNDQINDLCMEWFRECTAEGLHVTGPMVREKALQLAAQFGIQDFKASNGWLDSFLKRAGFRTASVKEFRKKYGGLTVPSALGVKREPDLDEDTEGSTGKRMRQGEISDDCSRHDLGSENEIGHSGFWEVLTGSVPMENRQPPADGDETADPVDTVPSTGQLQKSFVTAATSVSHAVPPSDKHTAANKLSDDEPLAWNHIVPVAQAVNIKLGKDGPDVYSKPSIKTDVAPTETCSLYGYCDSLLSAAQSETGTTPEHDDVATSATASDGGVCSQSVSCTVTSTSTAINTHPTVSHVKEEFPQEDRAASASVATSPGHQTDGIQCSGKVVSCYIPVQTPLHNCPATATDLCVLTTQDVVELDQKNLHTESTCSQHHRDTLLHNLYRLWQDNRLLDLQLDINGITVWVHKLVVLGLSPLANVLLAGGEGENTNCLKVRISKTVPRSAVGALVMYLYTGHMVLHYPTLVALQCLAQALHISHLEKLCRTYLTNCMYLAKSHDDPAYCPTSKHEWQYTRADRECDDKQSSSGPAGVGECAVRAADRTSEEDKGRDGHLVTGSARRKCRKPLPFPPASLPIKCASNSASQHTHLTDAEQMVADAQHLPVDHTVSDKKKSTAPLTEAMTSNSLVSTDRKEKADGGDGPTACLQLCAENSPEGAERLKQGSQTQGPSHCEPMYDPQHSEHAHNSPDAS